MTTAAVTAGREELAQIVRSLPDGKISLALGLLRVLSDDDEGDEPNEATARVLRESEEGINLIGPFKTIEELMASLMSDDDA
jgi:hypothetical protein